MKKGHMVKGLVLNSCCDCRAMRFFAETAADCNLKRFEEEEDEQDEAEDFCFSFFSISLHHCHFDFIHIFVCCCFGKPNLGFFFI